MRILHLTDSFLPVLGGIETHVDALSRHQAAAGDEVTVLTATPVDAEGQDLVDDGPVTIRRMRWAGEGFGADLESFDLVHAHVSVISLFAAPLAAIAARRGVPTVVTVHSLWDGLGPIPVALAALTTLRRAPVTWTAVSHAAATQVLRRLPRGTHAHVLPNAVEVLPRPAPRGSSADRPVQLVSTMRLASRKRPLQLLEMYAALLDHCDVPVHLTLVGDGRLRRAFDRRIRSLGIADAVTVTGRVAPGAVLEVLAASDVYVAPAVLESFGLAALEARCVGLPVVGRQGTGLADFVDPGTSGFLCASDEGMVAALRDLLVDPALRDRISEHNRTTPSEMNWANAMTRHEAVYSRALGLVPATRPGTRPGRLQTVTGE